MKKWNLKAIATSAIVLTAFSSAQANRSIVEEMELKSISLESLKGDFEDLKALDFQESDLESLLETKKAKSLSTISETDNEEGFKFFELQKFDPQPGDIKLKSTLEIEAPTTGDTKDQPQKNGKSWFETLKGIGGKVSKVAGNAGSATLNAFKNTYDFGEFLTAKWAGKIMFYEPVFNTAIDVLAKVAPVGKPLASATADFLKATNHLTNVLPGGGTFKTIAFALGTQKIILPAFLTVAKATQMGISTLVTSFSEKHWDEALKDVSAAALKASGNAAYQFGNTAWNVAGDVVSKASNVTLKDVKDGLYKVASLTTADELAGWVFDEKVFDKTVDLVVLAATPVVGPIAPVAGEVLKKTNLVTNYIPGVKDAKRTAFSFVAKDVILPTLGAAGKLGYNAASFVTKTAKKGFSTLGSWFKKS